MSKQNVASKKKPINNNVDTLEQQEQTNGGDQIGGGTLSTTTSSLQSSPIHKMLTEEKKQTLSTIVDKEACGEYILIDIIGKGGFGVVYKGLHSSKGYFSAIKKIRITKKKKGEKQAESQSQLMVEINLLKVLSHHNIVRYYDHIPSPTHSYIVMEFIENGSLEKMIKRHGLLPESLVNVYMSQVLLGLEYLHRQGVIHRDIKAANLLISTDGSIKLADFGVATKVSDLSTGGDDSFAGTPYWMAPEVIQMQGVSTACDVWSLGCTIIELLTGTPPYFGLAPAAALYKIVQEEHPPIPQGISAALKDFLLQCFKKDENMRSSAKQLLLHPWIKAISKNNPDINQLGPKNATMEILTYNAQLQEGIVVQSSPTNRVDDFNRPRSGPKNGPLPVPDKSTLNNQQNQQQQNTSAKPLSPNGSWIVTNHKQTNNNNNNTDQKTSTFGNIVLPVTNQKSTLQLGSRSPRPSQQQQQPQQQQSDNSNKPSSIPQTSPTLPQKSLSTSSDELNITGKPLKQKLQKYVEDDNEDDDDFFSKAPVIKTKKPTTPKNIQLNLKKQSAELSDDDWTSEKPAFDGFSSAEEDNVDVKLKNMKLSGSNTFTNNNNSRNSSIGSHFQFKVRETSEWDSEIEDNFDSINLLDDDDENDQPNNGIGGGDQQRNLHDKQKEQVIKTIVDLLSQLKPISKHLQVSNLETSTNNLNISSSSLSSSLSFMSASSSLSNSFNNNSSSNNNINNSSSNNLGELIEQQPHLIIDRLAELLQRFPEERRLLYNNGEGGVYFRLPLITMLEILDNSREYPGSLVLSILKLINQCLGVADSVNTVLLETICILNGIPIITMYATSQYEEPIREEVSKFVYRLCISSSYSLNMFIAGSRGCRVLVDLVDSDYFNSSSLIHNTLDSISQIFKMTTALPKTSLCHLFSQTPLLHRLSLLLHQIFIPSELDTQQLLEHKNKVKNNTTNAITTPANGGKRANRSTLTNTPQGLLMSTKIRGSSVHLLPKDSFDRVLAYSVKAADIMLFFSSGDSQIKEEMSCEKVLGPIAQVLAEIHTWKSIVADVRAFLLRMLKVIKNLSMDQVNRSKLDNVDIIPILISFLGYNNNTNQQGGSIEKISEIYNQVLHSLYYLLLLDKPRQDKALRNGILNPLLAIINERGTLKELALPILFDFVRLTSPNSREILWQSSTLDKLLVLIEDKNWFADAIESIGSWAQLESTVVYEKLTTTNNSNSSDNNGAVAASQLILILNGGNVRHPSFSKALIPFLQLLSGSSLLVSQLLEVGLIPQLIECINLDANPVSKITMLKIIGLVITTTTTTTTTITTTQYTLKKDEQDKLTETLEIISKEDESDIVKKIAGELLLSFSK